MPWWSKKYGFTKARPNYVDPAWFKYTYSEDEPAIIGHGAESNAWQAIDLAKEVIKEYGDPVLIYNDIREYMESMVTDWNELFKIIYEAHMKSHMQVSGVQNPGQFYTGKSKEMFTVVLNEGLTLNIEGPYYFGGNAFKGGYITTLGAKDGSYNPSEAAYHKLGRRMVLFGRIGMIVMLAWAVKTYDDTERKEAITEAFVDSVAKDIITYVMDNFYDRLMGAKKKGAGRRKTVTKKTKARKRS